MAQDRRGRDDVGHGPRALHRVAGRIDEDELLEALRMGQGVVPGDAPAPGVAGQGEALDPDLCCDLVDGAHHGNIGVVVARHRTGQSVAGHVQADQAERFPELGDPWLPGVERCVGAVDEDEGRTVPPALVPDVNDGAARDLQEPGALICVPPGELLGWDVEPNGAGHGSEEGQGEDGEDCFFHACAPGFSVQSTLGRPPVAPTWPRRYTGRGDRRSPILYCYRRKRISSSVTVSGASS